MGGGSEVFQNSTLIKSKKKKNTLLVKKITAIENFYKNKLCEYCLFQLITIVNAYGRASFCVANESITYKWYYINKSNYKSSVDL